MSDPAPTSWTDPGWLADFTGWATDELATLGFKVTGPPEQTHIRPWSTVVRLPTEGAPFWAKAMRPSTSHEARLLPAMGAWGVSAVIAPLAVEEVHSWVLLEDGGPTLRQTRPDGTGDHDLAAWEGILATYAELQRSLEARTDELLRLGVPDGRPTVLRSTLDALVSEDRWWSFVGPGERASSDAARDRLRGAGDRLAAAAEALDGFGIAPTIQHDDLHGGNVFAGPSGVRFFDWGDAVVAHPFGTMLATLNSIAHRLGTSPDDTRLDRVRDAYLAAWTDVLPRDELGDVLALAIDLGRIGKAAAWARALDGLDPAQMEGHGDAPALWLTGFAELLDAGAGR